MLGCIPGMVAYAQALAKLRAEEEVRFNALPREEQEFQLLKRQTEALERIARQGPPQVTIETHSSIF